MERFTIKEAYDYLKGVHPNKWTTDYFKSENCYCALGHLCRLESINPEYAYFESKAHGLQNFLWNNNLPPLSNVNDGLIDKYNQEKPKKRVLTYLKDLMEQGYD